MIDQGFYAATLPTVAGNGFTQNDIEYYGLHSLGGTVTYEGLSEIMRGSFDQSRPVIAYDNTVTASNISTTQNTPENPITNAARDSTAEVWRGGVVAEQDIFITPRSQGAIDYIAIAGHNLYEDGYQISIDYDDGGWQSIAANLTPHENGDIIYHFAPIADKQIRIRLTIATPVIAPKISYVMAGRLLTLPRGIHVGHTPLKYGRQTNVINNKSESGAFLGRVKLNTKLSSSISMSNISPLFFRKFIFPFQLHAETKPFIFSWKPFKFPDETYLCWSTNDLSMSNADATGLVDFSINIEGSPTL